MMEQASSPSKTSSESLSRKSLCRHPADSPVALQDTHSEFRLLAVKDLEVLVGWNLPPNLGTQCIFWFQLLPSLHCQDFSLSWKSFVESHRISFIFFSYLFLSSCE